MTPVLTSTQMDTQMAPVGSTDWGISQIPHLPPDRLRTYFANIHDTDSYSDSEIALSVSIT